MREIIRRGLSTEQIGGLIEKLKKGGLSIKGTIEAHGEIAICTPSGTQLAHITHNGNIEGIHSAQKIRGAYQKLREIAEKY